MAFSDPIVAGEELIRTGIRSSNYAAGLAGWRVARNGDAEFNDVLIRGELIVGPDPGQHIEVIPDANFPLAGVNNIPGVVLYNAGGDIGLLTISPTTGAVSLFAADPTFTQFAALDLDPATFTAYIGPSLTVDLTLTTFDLVVLNSATLAGNPIRSGTSGLEQNFATTVAAGGGRYTFNHGLGAIPSNVQITSRGPTSGAPILASVIVESLTAIQVTVRCLDNTGAAISGATAATHLAFNWTADP